MGLAEGIFSPGDVMTWQQRLATAQVYQRRGELCPAIYAEGNNAMKEREAATYVL
jgi:hypothetical protein